MKKLLIRGLLLASLCGQAGCSRENNSPTGDGANDAAGTGDPDLARQVTGVWLLSTDYNYDERCNYLPPEFVKSLFKIDKSVTLEKFDLPDGCELRWDGQKVGFYTEANSPYESVYKSEYAFDTLFQSRPDAVALAATVPDSLNDLKAKSYHGPKPQGTGAERATTGLPGKGSDASALNDSTNQPTPGITQAAAHLVTPAEQTATSVPVDHVGDKALWEPRKRQLHVLYLNHVLTIQAPMKGDEQKAKLGAMGLANYITGHLNNSSA